MSENEKFLEDKEQELFRHFRLGEHLLQRNMITLSQFNEAMQEQQRTGKMIGEIVVKNGFITKETLEECLNHQINADSIIDELKGSIKDQIKFKIVEE